MRDDDTTRSQRTTPGHDEDGSLRTTPTQPPKRGANTAYFLSRLAREHPEVLQALQRGEYRSVRAAANAAGLVHERTPLEQLHHAWRHASPDERRLFLDDLHLGTPPPSRLRRLGWDRWHQCLVQVRQYLMRFRHAELEIALFRRWKPEVRAGYAAELRQVIGDLTQLLRWLEEVSQEPTTP